MARDPHATAFPGDNRVFWFKTCILEVKTCILGDIDVNLLLLQANLESIIAGTLRYIDLYITVPTVLVHSTGYKGKLTASLEKNDRPKAIANK